MPSTSSATPRRSSSCARSTSVQILDTPKDFFPEFVRATNVVLDRYAKDAFFKEVLDSQRAFGKTVVPYWTKILDLYSKLGNAALKK